MVRYDRGELDDDGAVDRTLAGLRQDGAMATWMCYHVIGDQLRGAQRVSPGFAARFSAALAAEPTVLAPARTPRAILARLNEEAARAVRSPEVRERFAALVMDEMVMSLEEFNNFLAQDFQINAELVKAAGVQPN